MYIYIYIQYIMYIHTFICMTSLHRAPAVAIVAGADLLQREWERQQGERREWREWPASDDRSEVKCLDFLGKMGWNTVEDGIWVWNTNGPMAMSGSDCLEVPVIEVRLEVKLPTVWADQSAEVRRGREEKESVKVWRGEVREEKGSEDRRSMRAKKNG